MTTDTEPPSDPGYREDDTRTRIEKMRVRGETAAKELGDHEARIRSIEAWPMRWLLAFLAAAAGLVGTGIAGIQSLTRVEAAVDALGHRIERLEDRADEDARSWRRVDTTTHASED